MSPEQVLKFRRQGFRIHVEKGAGKAAGFSDEEYEQYGADIDDQDDIWKKNQIILKILAPTEEELDYLQYPEVLVSYVYPAQNKEFVEKVAAGYPNLTYFALDCVPRITRAQKLDSLSSMANLGGYKAVMEAFNLFQRFPKQQITAAGKFPPANVFIIGCGVAGLSAIGFAKNLGCVIRAFDTRPAAREQAESMGAEFLEVNVEESGAGHGGYGKVMSEEYQAAQLELTKETCKWADVIITTALIPGVAAPILVNKACVKVMRPGSVIVDMAAQNGGNCELTQKGESYKHGKYGVWIVGITDFVSRMAPQSTELIGNNFWHLMDDLGQAANFRIDMEDEIVLNMVVVQNGEVKWMPPHLRPQAAPPVPPAAAAKVQHEPTGSVVSAGALLNVSQDNSSQSFTEAYGFWIRLFIMAGLFIFLGLFSPKEEDGDSPFLASFLIFVLSIIIGYMVIWNVAPSLHTPLMAVTNAISGIIVIGGMLELASLDELVFFDTPNILGTLGVFFASINVLGGFVVTQRMLNMFRRD